MHEGHRKRMRERITKYGIDNLEDHELIEYILYQTYKQKNTNEIAHRLLNHFHRFDKILDASEEALMEVAEVGSVTAHFLSVLPQIFARYEKSRKQEEGVRFVSLQRIVEWLTPSYFGTKGESKVLLCLDADFNLIHEEVWKEEAATETSVSIKDIVAIVIKYDAAKVVFSHSHLTNIKKPSSEDVEFTDILRIALRNIGIQLIDHLIICPNGTYYSFKEEKGL